MSTPPADLIDPRRRLYSRDPFCAVCRRPPRGFGWFDTSGLSRPRPPVKFCSMTCQGFWARRARRSTAVIDLTEQEQAAIRAAMKPVAEVMEEIGWPTRLSELTEAHVLALIEVAVGGFQDAMHASAEADIDSEIPF